MRTVPPIIKYSGTAAVRISAVDGTAFVDNLVISALPQNGKVVAGPTSILANAALLDTTTANAFYGGAIDLAAYQTGNYALRLRNTVGGGTATAYISATAPSGEALSVTELSSDPNFNDNGAWTKSDGTWVVAGGKATATNSGTAVYINQAITTTIGWLIKATTVCDSITGGAYNLSVDAFPVNPLYNNAATNSAYRTASSVGGSANKAGIRATTPLSAVFDSISFKQVTMPVATGALLLSTKAGSRGWYSKDSTFDPNAAMTLEVLDISLTAFTDGNHSIELYPATTPSGRMLRGVLKAVGTSEGLGANPAAFASLNLASDWTKYAGVTTIDDANSFTATSAGGVYYKDYTVSLALYKSNYVATGGYLSLSSGAASILALNAGVDKYLTFVSSRVSPYANIAATIDITSISVRQVLTPSTTGSTIVSSKAGTTYNWSANTFIAADYNQASYYVVVKKIKGEVIMDTKTIDTGSALIDSTTANAFAAPLVSAAAYDFAAYQDGKHRLDIYSSAGVLWAQGYISSTAPSGLAAVTDVLAGWDLTSGWGKKTETTINDADTFTAGTTTSFVSKASVMVTGGLYLSTLVATAETGTVSAQDGSNNFIYAASSGVSKYMTNTAAAAWMLYHSGTTSGKRVDVTSQTSYRTTMPAATGALLLSTPGGARGYAFKSASFDPNAAGLIMKVVKVID